MPADPNPPRSTLKPWQKIAVAVFAVCLITLPLYCAFVQSETDAPPNPPETPTEEAPEPME